MKTFLKLTLSVIIFSSLYLNVQAQGADTWSLDKAHTSVNFSINHFFSAVTGKFSQFDGTFNLNLDDLQNSKVDFTINVKSVNTGDDKRDKHLQTSDFFDAKQFPNITFTSTKFAKKGDKNYIVYGKLTIKDVTKDIELPFVFKGRMIHPMMKNVVILGLQSSIKIDRTQFGVGSGSWAATAIVGDEVDININMELNKKK